MNHAGRRRDVRTGLYHGAGGPDTHATFAIIAYLSALHCKGTMNLGMSILIMILIMILISERLERIRSRLGTRLREPRLFGCLALKSTMSLCVVFGLASSIV